MCIYWVLWPEIPQYCMEQNSKQLFCCYYTIFDLIRYLVPGLSLYLQLKVDDFFCPISNYFKIIEYDRMDAPIVSGLFIKLYFTLTLTYL
jgi:hypothetical protein